MADDDELRRCADEEMTRLIEAAASLRQDLEQHEAVCRSILECIRTKEPLGQALEAANSQKWRQQLTRSLSAYEKLRHRARLRLIAIGLSEGMTQGDIQHHWGITRQLASRAVREVSRLE